MKLQTTTLATSIAMLLSMVSATTSTSMRRNRLAWSQAAKKALLSKALPVTREGNIDEQRSRQLNDQISVTIHDSIAFHSCLTLTTSLDNKVMETLQADAQLYSYWKSGQIVTTQSYVLFNICETGNCTSATENSLLMVDLESFMGLANFRPQKTIDYCDACLNAKQWCLYGQFQTDDGNANAADAAGDDAAAKNNANNNANNNNGGRYLAGQVTEQPVSCTTCTSMGCFDFTDDAVPADDGGHVNIENVVQWVEQLSQCENTGKQWYNMDVYAQFMCNSQGDGVEIGIFLDNECTVYTALESYGSLFNGSSYLTYSSNIVTYPFLNSINCAADIEWVSPENWDSSMASAVDDEYAAEANQYCQQLVQSKMLLPLDNCAANGYGYTNDANNDDGMFAGYSYDLAEKDIDDAYAVCTAIYNITHNPSGKSMKHNVQNKNVFNSSDTLYTYSKVQQTNHAGRSVDLTFLVLAVLGALGFVGWKAYQAKQNDSKRQPLVDGGGIPGAAFA